MHLLYKCLLSTHCVPSTVFVLGILKRAGQMPALEETQREWLIRESDKTGWVGPTEGTPHQPPTVCGVRALEQGSCPEPTACHLGSQTKKA